MIEMITKNHTLVAEFGDSLDRLLDGIENFMANSRPTLGGERFLTDKEVSARLKVSRRTLQDYRNNGIIVYYQLGGKILYKESDIERMLAANYREAFRRHPSFEQRDYDQPASGRIPYLVWSYILRINNLGLFVYMPLAKRTNITVLSDWRHIVSP